MIRERPQYEHAPVLAPGRALGRVRLVNELHAKGTPLLWLPSDAQISALVSTFWTPTVKVALDQLDIGRCTGNAVAHAASTELFGWSLNENDADRCYHRATQLDSFPGQYPPTDTGSSGWAAMAAVEFGWFKAFGLTSNLWAVLLALQTGPGVTGQDWFQGDDNPADTDGMVAPSGLIRGGHEWCIAGCEIVRKVDGTIDLLRSALVFRNSWGPVYGVTLAGASGYFRMRLAHVAALLAVGADAHFPTVVAS